MSADPKQHDTPAPTRGQGDAGQHEPARHPFDQALATWQAWSMANTMRFGLQQARQQGNDKLVRSFEQHPEWTQGPSPIAALRANHQVVSLLSGWQWHATRAAREQGHGWAEIGRALEIDAEQAKRRYLERVERQRLGATANPDIAHLIGYQPRWAELADPNDADRAHQDGRAEPGREADHAR